MIMQNHLSEGGTWGNSRIARQTASTVTNTDNFNINMATITTATCPNKTSTLYKLESPQAEFILC